MRTACGESSMPSRTLDMGIMGLEILRGSRAEVRPVVECGMSRHRTRL